MINYIWFLMMFLALLIGIISGQGAEISKSIVDGSGKTVEFIISLVGIMSFWCGVMKVAEKSGFTDKLAKVLYPILRPLYKDASKDKKALGAIVMNLTANMLGLSNAATPFGLKAMEEMQRLNTDKERASNDMCLFLVMNAACIQLVPTTVLSIRAAAGSQNPGIIILPAIISTGTALIIAVIVCKILQRFF